MIKIFILILLSVISRNVFGFVESPQGCFKHENSNCYFGTVKQKSQLVLNETKMYLGKKTILKNLNHKMYFIDGELVVTVGRDFKLNIESAQVSLTKGEYVFSKIGDEYVVRTLDGIADITTQSKNMQITEGFEVSIAVPSEYDISFSSLKVIPLFEHLKQYAAVKQLSKNEITGYINKFSKKHRNYEIWFAELNKKLIKRHIAEEKSLQRNLDEKAIRKAKELAQVRQLLYEKVFER